ncbi:phosphotransferase [Nocardioides sp. SYSU D00038]|uniref:phosphotransferase n=1 Tax=Nocardioides sp. SYSU D00038 TaxID=2812554 RepID=UPI0027DC08B6|nr:phosphotransferase [Nocardioides sp. SYSU D00038]
MSSPSGPAPLRPPVGAYPVPAGRTARRLEWVHLPPHLRSVVEERCGSPVVAATSCTGGFTPGFASALTCADGSRHFVKAASVQAQRMFADAYREEARKLAALPPETPAPRLLWTHDGDWVALGTELVEGTAPARPWREDQLAAALDLLARTARVLTPGPPGLALDPFSTEFATWPDLWERMDALYPSPRNADAAALAARFAEVVDGDTVVHTDVRDDNLVVRADGSMVLCDWNWPVRGAAWLDSLLLLIGPRGDGLDVERVLAEHPTFASVTAEQVDIVLALVIPYFLTSGAQPRPPTSPYIRAHQTWQGDVLWDWLCERRGWE